MPYQIAAGHDNEAGFQNVETLLRTPINSTTWILPIVSLPLYREGITATRANGSKYYRGFRQITWLFSEIYEAQVSYLEQTFEQVNQGKVTIQSLTPGNPAAFTDHNAVIRLGERADVRNTPDQLYRYTEFPIYFRVESDT